MRSLFHVSPRPLQTGILKLGQPTSHFRTYTRGFECSPVLGNEGLEIPPTLQEQYCFRCRKRPSCHANGPCVAVAELLLGNSELHHRAHEFVEHLFEWLRKQQFSHLPSRFNSFFCWEHPDDARWFREKFRNGQGYIYEVAPSLADTLLHRGDMKWLDCLLKEDVPTMERRARAYWGRLPCPDPGGGRWEILVPCDLIVTDEITLG